MTTPRMDAESIQKLSGCHPDLVRVMVRASKVTGISVLQGMADPASSTDPMAKDLRRPSDAATAMPEGVPPPQEPDALTDLSTGDQKQIRQWVHYTARWHYLGGVVMGVAEALHDQRAIEQPVRWMGATCEGNSGLARFERGT